MYRKEFLLIILLITIFVLNNCASIKPYKGKPLDADSINCEAGIGCADIRTGKYFIDIKGIKREFILTLPEDYDNSKSYPLIFAWHGLGGSARRGGWRWGHAPRGIPRLAAEALAGTIALGSDPGGDRCRQNRSGGAGEGTRFRSRDGLQSATTPVRRAGTGIEHALAPDA